MSYVGITKSFHRDGSSLFQGLGASDDPDVAIDYYAPSSQLRWRSNSVKTMHSRLKKMDADWHIALSNLPLDLIPDEGLRIAAQAFASYPLPVASEIALALEVLWGNRPFDESCVSVLLFARDRLLGSAGAMAAAAGTAGLLAGVMAFVPVDLGISAVSLAAIATTLGAGSAVLAGLGGIIAALAKGEAPRKSDLDLMVGGASAMTGSPKPGSGDQRAAIAALAERQDEEDSSDRIAALTTAKAASKRKADACRARGGVFDPKAPGGCRVINQKRTEEKLKQAGINVSGSGSLIVPAGLAALGVIGVYLLWPKKPRQNPKPKRSRR